MADALTLVVKEAIGIADNMQIEDIVVDGTPLDVTVCIAVNEGMPVLLPLIVELTPER